MGTLLDRSSDKDAMKIANRKGEVVWSTPIEAAAWQNFAVTVDYQKKYGRSCLRRLVTNSVLTNLLI